MTYSVATDGMPNAERLRLSASRHFNIPWTGIEVSGEALEGKVNHAVVVGEVSLARLDMSLRGGG